MKKSLALLALLSVMACGEEKKTETEAPKAAPTELAVYIWTNYHSPAAIARFETEHNVKVTIDTYDNNEVIEQKLQSGTAPYDIVVPTDYMVKSLVKQDLLLPLDETKLTNLGNLNPVLDRMKAEGKPRYSVPYLWGTTGLSYRTDKVEGEIDSWNTAFDPKYKGRIVMLDDVRETFGAALRTMGKSINTTEPEAIEAAKKKLQAQKDLILAYDSSDFAGKIAAGDGWVVQGYSGELARVARESNGTIRYIVPKEGGTLATDNLAIPKASRNPELALEFINFMMDADIAADTANVTGYATANKAALPKVNAELLNDPGVYPSDAVLANCETIEDLGEFMPTVDLAWTEVKAQ